MCDREEDGRQIFADKAELDLTKTSQRERERESRTSIPRSTCGIHVREFAPSDHVSYLSVCLSVCLLSDCHALSLFYSLVCMVAFCQMLLRLMNL